MCSWLSWHYLSHVCPSSLLCFTPKGRHSALEITFRRRFINTKYTKHALLSISLLLSAVMMYFTWQSQWNLLHPGDGTEGRKMGFHLLNANPFSITQNPLMHGAYARACLCSCKRKRIAQKCNPLFEKNGERKVTTAQVWKHILLSVSVAKLLCVLLDILIRQGMLSFFFL